MLTQVSSTHLHCFCEKVLFTRWCGLMFPAALGWCAVEHCTTLCKDLMRTKGPFVSKRFFSSSLKAYHERSWSLTPSFCFSFGHDMEGHEVCHSETDISFAGPRFECVCLRSHSKEIRHPSIFWGSKPQGMVWILISSIPRLLINWGLCTNQLVYLTVRQYTISLNWWLIVTPH